MYLQCIDRHIIYDDGTFINIVQKSIYNKKNTGRLYSSMKF